MRRPTKRPAAADRDAQRAVRYAKQHGYRSRKKQTVPWWGWAIFVFLGLKACSMGAQYIDPPANPPAAPTAPAAPVVRR
jgi:hypothetical protein